MRAGVDSTFRPFLWKPEGACQAGENVAICGRMKTLKSPLFAAALLGAALGGCEKKLPEDPGKPLPQTNAEVTAEPAEPVAPVAQETASDEAVVSAETGVAAVKVPEKVDLDPETLENQRVKDEVLKRIDLMPSLTPEEKDKLYVQVERARAMGKVITIPFDSGKTSLNAADRAALGEKLGLEQVRSLTDDPTVVFVILGFADKKGDPDKNLEISLQRANAVLKSLRDEFRLMNVMHTVGMGSSEMFDADNLDKNRVAEVWAVLP